MDKIILFVLFILLAFGACYYYISINVENNFHSTKTRALCSGTTCRDFLISCYGQEVIEIAPISGFVTFGEDWIDKRYSSPLC